MAPPVEPPSTITLRIKVPPGHIEGGADEFTLGTEVPVNAKIGEVRDRIQHIVPSNPSPDRQRLLYGGRALVDNEQTLADALNIRRDPTQDEYVVHLLVKGDGTATAPVPQRRGLSTPGRASPAQPGQQPLPAAGDSTQQTADAQGQHIHHDHAHQQHIQQHQAALAAQQQQLLHALNHLPPTQGQPPAQMPLGLNHMHLGGGFPMFPLGQPFGQQHQGQAMPPQHAQTQTPQIPVAQADGATDTHPPEAPNPTGLPEGQPRSASQPPPRPRGHGVVLEGRGPNGERFHFQQHIQLAHQAALPPGIALPQLPQFEMPQFPQHQAAPRRPGPSALEQARDNIAEMRRMLSELRGLDVATDDQRDRIDRIQQRTQEVNNYIDPFNLGGSHGQANTSLNGARIANTAQGVPMPMQRPVSQPPRVSGISPFPPTVHQAAPVAMAPRSSSDVTCYLLSSPTGPQAILYSPQHGTYTGGTSQTAQAETRIDATPTRQPEGVAAAAPAAANAQPPVNLAQAVAAQPGAAPAQQDGLGAMGPGLINHMWLLMRVLIFAYFILGANLGWRRPLALLAIALGFWLLRQGPLGEGGILRRWWDGIVNQNQRPQPAQGDGQQQQAQGQAGDVRPGQMPTPAQVAQRLLDEDRQQRNHRLSWLREQIRPAERAVALLIASLWPGVGEAYVRALEAEERRRNEEEVAARRREEEERQRREEEEKQKAEGNATNDAANDHTDASNAGISAESAVAGESSEKGQPPESAGST
ncbi:Putative Ubiquitin-like domain-containing protein [Septoria linicola]|uniref:Ubiquitin-like domain-containing protein n=1 Tax=Septoria linicola TaxID=215465 RepID=A0A9Q9ANQ5_9PEZI|nr:putative Ubiquitin-like domain-containing protein [Septoria linicola]USW49347.1 Putative Ubiquitin-like domain-containing protein [Septoria linicola]